MPETMLGGWSNPWLTITAHLLSLEWKDQRLGSYHLRYPKRWPSNWNGTNWGHVTLVTQTNRWRTSTFSFRDLMWKTLRNLHGTGSTKVSQNICEILMTSNCMHAFLYVHWHARKYKFKFKSIQIQWISFSRFKAPHHLNQKLLLKGVASVQKYLRSTNENKFCNSMNWIYPQ